MGLLDILGIGKKRKMINEALANGAPIIDVRTPGEFSQGHPKGAINIPLNNLEGQLKKIKTMKQPIILCCASGMRSGTAASMLKQHNIDCYNAGSWTSLP